MMAGAAYRRGALVASALLTAACANFHVTDRELAETFAGGPSPSFHTLATGGRELFVAELGDPTLPTVFLLHGSPGSWTDFLELFRDRELTTRVHLVAVDRPGFGRSRDGGIEPSLARQVELLSPLLAEAGTPVLVVGHSLGGPLAARVVMDRPERVSGLVLVAGSIDPALEKTTWFQRLGRTRAVRWMVPDLLVAADEEIRPLRAELEALQPRWSEIRVPVWVIQGERDRLVPAANADFAARVLDPAQLRLVRVPKLGHLIPWKRPDLIREAILAWVGGRHATLRSRRQIDWRTRTGAYVEQRDAEFMSFAEQRLSDVLDEIVNGRQAREK